MRHQLSWSGFKKIGFGRVDCNLIYSNGVLGDDGLVSATSGAGVVGVGSF